MVSPNQNPSGTFDLRSFAAPASNPSLILPAPGAVSTAISTAGEATTRPTYDLGTILRALQRRWILALTLGILVSGGAALAAWYFIPVKSTASTLLRVEADRPSVLFQTQEDRINFTNYQRDLMTLLKSRPVLRAALDQPGVADRLLVRQQEDKVDWLVRNIQADFSLAPQYMKISLSAYVPDDLPVVVDAVRDAFVRWIVDKEKSDRRQRLASLQVLLKEKEAELSAGKKRLRTLGESVGSEKTVAYLQQFANDRFAMAHKELLQLQSDLQRALVEWDNLPKTEEALRNLKIPDSLVEEQIRKEKQVELQQAEIARFESDYETAKKNLNDGEDAALARPYRAKLEKARASLEALKQRLRAAIEQHVREQRRSQLLDDASRIQSKIANLKSLRAKLEDETKTISKDSQSLNKGAIALEELRGDLSHIGKVADKAEWEIEVLRVELDARSRVSIMEDASVSKADAEKRRFMVAGGVGAGGFALVLFGIVSLELQARRLGTVSEIKKKLNMPLVGVLPAMPSGRRRKKRGSQTTVSNNSRGLIEAVDATRTVLLGSTREQPFRCVMVTSAVSGEGKTSLSCHLAASLARIGFRTLLIDGDLRRPLIHELFGRELGAGFGEILRGQASLPEVIQATPMPGLWVMSAGRSDALTFQGLARERAPEIFSILRQEYDFIIVDSPPVLPVADSLLVSQHVDGVIFSILQDVSRLPSVLAAYERLNMVGTRILGAVVNGVSADFYGPKRYYSDTSA